MLHSTEEAGGNAGGTGEQLEGKSLLEGDQVIAPGRGQEPGVVPSCPVLPREQSVLGSRFHIYIDLAIFLSHLNNYGKAEVEIEISSEGGGSGCEAVVAHGGHHPVEEHHRRPDEDGQGVEEVQGGRASFTFLTGSQG